MSDQSAPEILTVRVTESETLEPGEYPVQHIAHLGGEWFELRAAGAPTYARVRIERSAYPVLLRAGFLTRGDMRAITRLMNAET